MKLVSQVICDIQMNKRMTGVVSMSQDQTLHGCDICLSINIADTCFSHLSPAERLHTERLCRLDNLKEQYVQGLGSQVAERLGNRASNQNVDGSIPGSSQ